MKKPAIIAAVIAAVLIVLYVSSLKIQISEAAELQASYRKEIGKLQAVKEGESLRANSDFLKLFFNYSNTKQRNDEIKPYMTVRGFQSIQAGASLDEKTEIETSAANISTYEKKISKSEAEYLNEFDLTVKFNSVSNTDKVFVRTKLLFIEGQGWKIDSIEYIGEVSRRDKD